MARESHIFWINGPEFLWQIGIVTHPLSSCVSAKRLNVDENLLVDRKNVCALDKLIEVSPDLYTLKLKSQRFGAAVQILQRDSSYAFDAVLKRINQNANNAADMKRVSELKTLRHLRPCVGTDSILRVEERLENAELPLDCKHPIILSGSHALTRLIVLHEHVLAGRAGPSYTLMKVRQRFWVIHGVSNVERFLSECSGCARRKATPIR